MTFNNPVNFFGMRFTQGVISTQSYTLILNLIKLLTSLHNVCRSTTPLLMEADPIICGKRGLDGNFYFTSA
jgi:hypothetical protein